MGSPRRIVRALPRHVAVALLASLASAGISGPGSAQVPAQVTKLNGPFPHVSGHAISPDGSRVAFLALGEIYTVPIDASSAPIQLNPPLDPTFYESVAFLAFTPDGTRILFQTVSDGPVGRLFSAPADGSASAVLLDDLAGAGPRFQITPDGSRAVYVADNGGRDLYSVPVDGSLAPTELSSLASWGHPFGTLISPDSSKVVYLADRDANDVIELYVVPIDGLGATLELNANLVTGGDVEHFLLSPDGQRVVYRADQDVNGRFELWSVPLDASQAPVKVSGTLIAQGDVLSSTGSPPFRISSDGARVVFRADALVDERFELFSAPLTGGPVVTLNGPLPAGSDVRMTIWFPFELSPDGTRVVYCADQDAVGVFEVFSVPIAGGPGVKLNAPLSYPATVERFKTTPDGTRVLYSVEVSSLQYELFSVPLDGSLPALRLDAAAPTQIGLPGLEISPDSTRVAFGALELSGTLAAGGSDLVRLSSTLTPGGSLYWGNPGSEFRFSPDSRHIVYEADQDTDGVVELYVSRYPQLARRASGPTDLR